MFSGGSSDPFVFTGKERDAESGNDYFGARYYNNNLGRWMSPDWAAKAEAVPYSDFSDPQSVNLYAYVRNNPTSRTDADGHLLGLGNSNGWFNWAVNLGQRFDNWSHGLGFSTDKQVESNLHQANQYLRQQGVSTEGLRDAAILKTYQTYTKTNPETDQVYSGRTSGILSPEENVKLRDRAHHMNEKGYGPAELDKSSSNPDAIRGREDQLIQANGGAQSQGGNLGNAINGISPTNPNKSLYCSACESEFSTEPGGIAEPIEPIEIPF